MIEIKKLLKKKFSLIPLAKGSKVPIRGFKWKQFQYKRAESSEIWDWFLKYGDDINIGIVCGLSKLANVDVDDPDQLKTLEAMVPELWETTRVKTAREGHYQFYFSTDGDKVRSTNKLFGLDGIELKAKGRYVVAPGSVVSGVRYVFERSLKYLKPVPKIISDEYRTIGVITGDITGDRELPRVKAKCVRQILTYDLPVGQRKKAYHIAYCKMRQEGHLKGYAISVCKEANKRISLPLTKKDDFDFGKIYNYGCPRINEELSFINCSSCSVRGGLHVGSLLMKNIHKLNSLTTSERSVLGVLDSYFRGESPTAYEVSKFITNSNQHTIKTAMDGLKEKGII